MHTKRWLLGSLAVAGVAAIGFAVYTPSELAPRIALTPPAPAQAALPAAAPSASLTPATRVLPASMPLSADTPPVGELVDGLLASGDPQDAYAAYLMVSSCAMFNDKHELQLYDASLRTTRKLNADEQRRLTKLCGQMTERQRQARLDHLAKAVKAGVPGAAFAFMSEGPFGDPSALKTRPDDPLVREWKATVAAQMTRAAEAGDIATLMVWGFQTLNGSELVAKQPELGYGYLLAVGLIDADRFGPKHETARAYAEGSELMNILGTTLSAAQRAAAMAAARKIADGVKGKLQSQ